MKKIKITQEQLKKAKELESIDFLEDKYELPGMHGGLDHIEFDQNSIDVIDRGMTYGQMVLDNSYKFICID